MIPAIGYMVGAYIITRMFSLLLKNKEGKESVITIAFAIITILIAGFCMYVLFTGELNMADFSSL